MFEKEIETNDHLSPLLIKVITKIKKFEKCKINDPDTRLSSIYIYMYVYRVNHFLWNTYSMPENNVRLARSDSILTRNKDRKIDMDRDGGRQREGHFPGLCTGREGGGASTFIGLSRNIIHDHSYEMNCNCRYYLQGTG